MWEAVFTTCRRGIVCDAQALARAEAVLGFPLPASYRSFCLECGAGLVGGHVRIALPAAADGGDGADLVTVCEVLAHGVATARAEQGLPDFDVAGDDPSVVERACFFGRGEAGELFFWDVVPDRQEPDRQEYEIWVLAADLETIRFGGVDLVDLMRRLQGPAVRGVLGMGHAPLPSSFVGDDAVPDGTLLS